jgi:hypothetical protein
MTWKRWSYGIGGLAVMLHCLSAISPCQTGHAAEQPREQAAASTQPEDGIVIKNDSPLPDTHVGAAYEVRLIVAGGTPQFHWRIAKGTLPPGMKLTEDGLILGTAQQGGEYQFTVFLRDGNGLRKYKDFVIRVRSTLSLQWKSPAHVNGNRIEGSVEVSNDTPDEIDLTFVVLAVAGNGRATAIGYQHFPLKTGTHEMELPFGETLPPGGYVVHVDVVGEVARRNRIYRERLQTQQALQVTVGP